MIYIIILVSLFFIGLIFNRSGSYVSVWPEVTITISIMFLLILTFILGVIHLSAVSEVAKIEQLRTQIEELGSDARTEDILGKVADVNMYISSCRELNKLPTLDWFHPDKICHLKMIEIPK